MNTPQDIAHKPRPTSEALITTTVINKERHKAGVAYTKGIEYIANVPQCGDMIEPYNVQLSRATCELSGAFPFLFYVISYVLSHDYLKKVFFTEIPKGFYDSIVLPLDIFLNIALDDTPGVKELLMSELVKLEKNKPSKVVPFDEKTSVYGQPIVLAIGKDKAGYIKNIKREKRDGQTEVQILFMKCFFRETRGYIQDPKAIYAKLIAAQIKYLKALEERKKPSVKNPSLPAADEPIDKDPYTKIAAINRVREYLFLHDNGISLKIQYDIIDLLKHSQPQYIRIDGRSKGLIRDIPAAMSFLSHALTVIQIVYQGETGRRVTGFTLKNKNSQFLEVTFTSKNGNR